MGKRNRGAGGRSDAPEAAQASPPPTGSASRPSARSAGPLTAGAAGAEPLRCSLAEAPGTSASPPQPPTATARARPRPAAPQAGCFKHTQRTPRARVQYARAREVMNDMWGRPPAPPRVARDARAAGEGAVATGAVATGAVATGTQAAGARRRSAFRSLRRSASCRRSRCFARTPGSGEVISSKYPSAPAGMYTSPAATHSARSSVSASEGTREPPPLPTSCRAPPVASCGPARSPRGACEGCGRGGAKWASRLKI